MSAPEPTCSPVAAWHAMAKGYSVAAIAKNYGDDPGVLDRAVWAWRAKVTNSVRPPHMSTTQALAVRDLGWPKFTPQTKAPA